MRVRPFAGSLVIGAAAALACAAPLSAAAGPAGPVAQRQLVDRIVAVVDGEVITLAQLQRIVGLGSTEIADFVMCGDVAVASAAEHDEAPQATSSADEREVLDCLIDAMLIDRYVRRFPQFAALAADADAQFAAAVTRFPSEQELEQTLVRHGITLAEVRYDLERRTLIDSYIDVRYRRAVDVRTRDARAYYEDVFRPEMERIGEPVPPFETVEHLIRPILIETEVTNRVDAWIADLQRRAEIVVYLW